LKVEKINSTIKTINQIIHISDVHIRLLKKHDEYKIIFQKLFDKVESIIDDNSIIVVAGDIVHNKTELSPEMIDITTNFLLNLSHIAPTFVIAGNHDTNLNSKTRLDSLTPIMNLLQSQTDDLYYLRDTGCYTIADTDLVVMSVFDDTFDIDMTQLTSKNKIALYHGTINGSQSDTGFILKNDKINVKTFDGFDIVVAGDIHKHQFLQEYHIADNIIKPSIGYSSSLIQQNHGESFENHGFISWNINTKKGSFIDVENDYGYYTARVKNNQFININKLPKYARLKVLVEDDTPQSNVKELLAELRKSYSLQNVMISRVHKLKVNTELDSNKLTTLLGDIKNATHQNELIENFLLKLDKDFDKKLIDKIKDLNIKLNGEIKLSDVQRNTIYKLKRFEFSNMFSYGEDNVIDFTNLSDIVGLFAQNKFGKSAILDSLLFCIFDKCYRAKKAINVMNYNADWFNCKVCFEINDIDYFIERRAKKAKNGKVSVDVDFYYYDDNKQIQFLNGTERADTNAIIRTYVGTLENLLLTSFSVQGNNDNFIDVGQAECKDIIAYFLEVDIFDKLNELANKENKDTVKALKDLQSENTAQNLIDSTKKLDDLLLEKQQYEDSKKSYSDKNEDIHSQIGELNKKLITIDKSISNIDLLEEQKTTTLNAIESAKTKLTNDTNSYNIELESIAKMKSDYKLVNQEQLIKDYDDLQKYNTEKINTETEFDTLKRTAKVKKDKLDKLSKLEYDEDCTYCMNNIFVKDAIETKDSFANDKIRAAELVEMIKVLYDKDTHYKEIEEKYNAFNTLKENIEYREKNTIQILLNKKIASEKDLQIKESNLSIVTENIAKYHQNETNIINNKAIENDISELAEKSSSIFALIKLEDDNIITVIQKIAVTENDIKNINAKILKTKELEELNKIYTYYLQVTNRQGLPYQLISQCISQIESEINETLNQMVDFEIRLEMEGDDIERYIDYGDGRKWLLELTSGMERFVSSIAIRTALINISNLPRPNGFIIDEGFGTLDTENLNSVNQIFDYLKQYFDFIFIITHLPIVKDFADNLISISQSTEGVSHVKNI
jgi:DNA repair exonuclease SbcCD ATPase subunit